MTSRSIAFYGVGGTLLVAWLAAANMPGGDPPVPNSAPQPAGPPAPDAIATDVRSQALRLQQRLAKAPAPDSNPRNPFSFGLPPRPPHAAAPAAPEAAPLPVVPPPPALTLMGIAEESVPGGIRRTAIIAGAGDTLYMVVEGQAVGDRYKLTKIGADAVELEDTVTKAYRRLALR